MTEPVLNYETLENGRIVVMTLNRPDRMNALNRDLREAIAESWERFAKDDNAWVAVVTGSGAPSARGRPARAPRRCGGYARRAPAARPVLGLPTCRRPRSLEANDRRSKWICSGRRLQSGHECDIRIASETAEFGIAETRWNRTASWLHNLPRQMPLQQALELAMWGDARMSAQRAYEIGWVSRVVAPDKLMEEALSWAKRQLYLAPRAVRNFKQVLYRSSYLSPDAGRAFSTALQQNQSGMEDSKEGLRAFAEKRPPMFQNR